MAGSGFKTFATGDVLTASDVNGYLMQGVLVFSTATARDAAITSPSEGMFAYTTTTPANTLSYYDASSWVAVDLAGDITGVTAGTNISGGGTSGTVTVNLAIDAAVAFGSDGSGVDATWHSDTAGDSMVWDSSAESLTITGTNGQDALVVADGDVSITDALTVTGTTTTYLNVITDTGTARTPALTDAGAYILCTHGSGMTITLPQDSAVAFPVGTQIVFERNGAGTLTFAAGTGATVNSKDGTLTCATRYTTVAAVKIAANTFTIFGNIG